MCPFSFSLFSLSDVHMIHTCTYLLHLILPVGVLAILVRCLFKKDMQYHVAVFIILLQLLFLVNLIFILNRFLRKSKQSLSQLKHGFLKLNNWNKRLVAYTGSSPPPPSFPTLELKILVDLYLDWGSPLLGKTKLEGNKFSWTDHYEPTKYICQSQLLVCLVIQCI